MSALDDVEFYRMIRGRLEHEDGLTVNRLSWLVASQSFLFTAYALTLNGLAMAPPSPMTDRQATLCRLIPLVGLLTTAMIYAGLLAGAAAMTKLLVALRERLDDERRLGLPAVLPPPSVMVCGQLAPRVLPLVFVVVWLYLFVVGGRG